jgi:hypothetical protein
MKNMSSYLVDDKSLCLIATYLVKCKNTNENTGLTDIHYPCGEELDDKIKALAIKLKKMNVKALDIRYGIGKVKAALELSYSRSTINDSKYQVLKSIECYLYQCSEGAVIKSKLYKAIKNEMYALGFELVKNTPAYEKVKWE